MSEKEKIIEHLITNQSDIKDQVMELRLLKNQLLATYDHVFRLDLEEQYEARIRQIIGYKASKALAIPLENVIIVIESIELEDYLNV